MNQQPNSDQGINHLIDPAAAATGFPSDFPNGPNSNCSRKLQKLSSSSITGSGSRNDQNQSSSSSSSSSSLAHAISLQNNINRLPSSESSLMYHHSVPRSKPPSSDHQSKPTELKEPRKCWICYDDEDEEEEEGEGDAEGGDGEVSDGNNPRSDSIDRIGQSLTSQSVRDDRKHGKITKNSKYQNWVKACKCSLTAHESLSHPTSNNASSPLSTPVKCPQCDTPYRLSQPDYRLLDFIYRLRKPYVSCLSWSALGCVFLGLGVATSSYGLWASRCFLGSSRWKRWITSSDDWRGLSFVKMFQLSLVGPILILSRTRQLDSVLPFLPISLILSNLRANLIGDLPSPDFQTIRLRPVFPPDPALTLCLIPWARIGWSWIWGKVTDFVLRREYRSLSHLGLSYRAGGAGRNVRGGIQRVNQPNVRGRHLGVEVEVAAEDGDNEDGDEDGDEGVGMGAQMGGAELQLDYLTLRVIIRRGTEALFLPGAASVAGNLLYILSKNRVWLKTILGLRRSGTKSHSGSFLNRLSQAFKKITGMSPSITVTTMGMGTPLMMRMMLNEVEDEKNLGKFIPKRLIEHLSYDDSERRLENLTSLAPSSSSSLLADESEDPIWWRNTIGGGLIIIVKDVLNLVEKVMKLRKLSHRKIIEVD
ncbi:hypothetical protein PPACK8108_LOCUS17920 [Phakopsora pachyrhizi]|uniref:Uncharacterized protein n=1 Tax=Phakopsora pachyrhizi TaxID=170000 RepID=A0AAV0BBK1_PHAPC|nr:hypothetical protein PPACK8108_LOCUS17920 [Phakopsora pachyrhizi]